VSRHVLTFLANPCLYHHIVSPSIKALRNGDLILETSQ